MWGGEGGVDSPGDAEGVRGPSAVAGEVGVDVGAGAEAPRAGEMEGHAASLGGEGLDSDGGGALAGDIVIEEAGEAEEELDDPEGEDKLEPRGLWEGAGVAVDDDAGEGAERRSTVHVEEGLVEGVADGGQGLQEDEEKECDADDAGLEEVRVGDGLLSAFPALGLVLKRAPREDVRGGFGDDDARGPAVEEVECVEADLQQGDQGIVAEGEENGRDQVVDA